MNDNSSLERSKSLLDIAVRDFAPACQDKHHTLTPFRDHIASLRAKGASYRIISALLQSAEVKVSHETVARFCRDVIGEGAARHKSRKPSRNKPRRTVKQPMSDAMSQSPSTALSQDDSSVVRLIHQRRTEEPSTPMSAVRTKGPRIADPKKV